MNTDDGGRGNPAADSPLLDVRAEQKRKWAEYMRKWSASPAGIAARLRRKESGQTREKSRRYRRTETGKANSKAATLAWRLAHPEMFAAQKKRERIKNRERDLKNKKAYYLKNKERMNAASRARYATNRLEELEKYAKAYAADPEKFRLRAKVAKARRKGAEGTFSQSDVDDIYRDQKGLCLYCGAPLLGKYQIEHKVPLVRGGSNWPMNIGCSCAPCNMRKGTKTSAEFFEQLIEEKKMIQIANTESRADSSAPAIR